MGTFKKTLKSNSGFSLIELMVVVAIIGILATIAVPKVAKFMAKARQSEVKGNLSAIFTANKSFFVEYNGYHTRFQVFGYSPEGELHYNVGFATDRTTFPSGYNGSQAGDNAACTSAGTDYCDASGTTSTYSRCKCLDEALVTLGGGTASDTAFTAVGTGKIVRTNTNADEWSINEFKRLAQTTNGID